MRHWLYIELWWAVHNLVAHPLSQFLWWVSIFGFFRPVVRASDWIHDVTVPVHHPHEGRG
jgi:hypothetical protein